MNDIRRALAVSTLIACSAVLSANAQSVPPDIQAIFNQPFYQGATWGLRVIDLESGQTLINLRPDHQFFIGSVRKVFTTGELLSEIGPSHTYNTPIYRQGAVGAGGTLQGDLILVASGDLTMGGRTKPDGTVAYTDFDHNEANSLMNAVLTKPNPLAGYAALARQVAASGIKEIKGEVIIDDRLFEPFTFRGEFEAKPIFVNDDAVDLILRPTEIGELASLEHRPHSAALKVENAVMMEAAGTDASITPGLPTCIGDPGCTETLTGDLPLGFVPPLTRQYPLIRTFRITDPSSYARTVLIEQLRAAGIKVKAPTVEPNPSELLPAKDCYQAEMRVAELQGLPSSENVKFVNKVSYNLGADTSLLLFGLTQGVDSLQAALAVEQKNLQSNFGIDPDQYFFIDGSGGGDSTATIGAVTHMLADMTSRPVFPQFFASLPIMGVDGSLATVTDFESDPGLAPAKGQVHAKPGTYVGLGPDNNPSIKAQAFGGYIHTKSGKTLVYQLVVNGVPFQGISDVLRIFQDEGTISAILWRDN
jgi:D-alanyl-D-alanine carboxypeptidase